jgi:hypothetical protein
VARPADRQAHRDKQNRLGVKRAEQAVATNDGEEDIRNAAVAAPSN